ncbi:procathepsin L-like [Callorhinchus milii]|uniref:procathepsin L-like n=1 Tax=Callorhinchus milii TaxID=7868 RepID=UPI001C3FEDC3|nr:procathepsin L-like [Callorhinchus milii]
MELSLFATCLLITVSTAAIIPGSDEEWEVWKATHGKNYYSLSQEIIRRTIWWENNKKIEAHNAKHRDSNHTFKMAMNHFGDWTALEFGQLLANQDFENVSDKVNQTWNITGEEIGALPQGVCWTSAGYVTEVKYQGPCSSCWAFSVTGSLEGQLFKKTGKLISLSEQNLVDCSRGYGSNGCNGGWPSQAYQYIKDNRGIEATATYPYIAKEHSTCNYDGSNKVTSISGFKVLPFGNEAALAKAVAEIGPIAVVIDASLASFQFYSSGVYYDVECKSNKYNHAVLVVGYGVQGGQNYWNVKNSWGVFWGNNGYIRMAKDRNNHCAIASYPMYPEI